MEKMTAILFADLSGYSATTEAHGAVMAADIIDQYLNIIAASLVGDARLHERTGDEVMIIATAPDALAQTAVRLRKNTLSIPNFLQLHGGLHHGPLLLRNNGFFGHAINLASRIAKNAPAGSFHCSHDFYVALSPESRKVFQPAGQRIFKNMDAPVEVYKMAEHEHGLYTDPVCKMLIDRSAIPHPTDPEIYFCSTGCLEVFFKRNNVEG
jgi:class 3 adenylate cyclase/YHS domain-containing protein